MLLTGTADACRPGGWRVMPTRVCCWLCDKKHWNFRKFYNLTNEWRRQEQQQVDGPLTRAVASGGYSGAAVASVAMKVNAAAGCLPLLLCGMVVVLVLLLVWVNVALWKLRLFYSYFLFPPRLAAATVLHMQMRVALQLHLTVLLRCYIWLLLRFWQLRTYIHA